MEIIKKTRGYIFMILTYMALLHKDLLASPRFWSLEQMKNYEIIAKITEPS